MNDDILISVLTPVFNSERTILRAINSVLNQTHKHFEYIIVNDGSKDNTEEIVSRVPDKRIKYLKMPDNQGAPSALNEGLKIVRGEYICFIDSDDEWLPQKLEKQLEAYLSLNRNIGLVYTNGYRVLNGQDKEIDIPGRKESGVIFGEEERRRNYFPCRIRCASLSSWMIKRNVHEKVGGIDKNFRTLVDLGYLVEIANSFDIYFLNLPLVVWHCVPGHLSTVDFPHLQCKEYFFNKFKSLIKKDRKYCYDYHRALGKEWNSIRYWWKAIKHWLPAILLNPFNCKLYFKATRALVLIFLQKTSHQSRVF